MIFLNILDTDRRTTMEIEARNTILNIAIGDFAPAKPYARDIHVGCALGNNRMVDFRYYVPAGTVDIKDILFIHTMEGELQIPDHVHDVVTEIIFVSERSKFFNSLPLHIRQHIAQFILDSDLRMEDEILDAYLAILRMNNIEHDVYRFTGVDYPAYFVSGFGLTVNLDFIRCHIIGYAETDFKIDAAEMQNETDVHRTISGKVLAVIERMKKHIPYVVAKKQCQVCLRVCPEIFRCGTCKRARYCSVACQKFDYRTHRHACVC